jgi:2-desacetyl-2-hydroxyethyl bacteriochlorophyllide A dehydrogenase
MRKSSMKCAVWLDKGEIGMEERPIPEVGEDEVLIEVAYSGLCASDLHIIEGDLPPSVLSPPRILGHEFSGTVAATGSQVKDFKEKDRVVAHPNGPCGECFFCRGGEENLCTNVFSVIRGPGQGSFADYIVVKAKQVYHLPETISLKDGALVEPTAVAVHCVDRAAIRPGETVVVMGGGTIGLLTMQIARLAGASLMILSEPVAFKRDVARETGADLVCDPTVEDLEAVVREATNGLGVDVCIEAAGAPSAIEQGFGLIRDRGRLVIVSWPPAESSININPFYIYRRELEIRGSFFSPYSFQRAINILPRLQLEPLVTHCLELNRIDEALEIIKTRKGIKVLMEP